MENENIITLVNEDGSTLKCIVVLIYSLNDYDYIALLPLESDEDADLLLYRYVEKEDGVVEFGAIETKEEFEDASSELTYLLEDLYTDEDESSK